VAAISSAWRENGFSRFTSVENQSGSWKVSLPGKQPVQLVENILRLVVQTQQVKQIAPPIRQHC
jgi:hypothetical protein